MGIGSHPAKGVAGSPGKQPLQESRKRQLGPDDAALIIERNSDISAVGLWTGPKNGGIVIVDADHNDTALRRKYKELKDAPRITSPRKNAAKYLFRVPKEIWREVTGFGRSQEHNEGFEVLWTNQGLIFGEYPGSKTRFLRVFTSSTATLKPYRRHRPGCSQ